MEYCETMDKVLRKICNSGKIITNYIVDYTENIGKELEYRGFIILKDCMNYIETSPTSRGKEFCIRGGYTGEISCHQQKVADAKFDRDSKQHTMWYENVTVWISILSLILSMIAFNRTI